MQNINKRMKRAVVFAPCCAAGAAIMPGNQTVSSSMMPSMNYLTSLTSDVTNGQTNSSTWYTST